MVGQDSVAFPHSLAHQPPVPFFAAFPITILPLSSQPLPHPPHSPSLSLSVMPTCRRKRVILTEPSDALLHAAKADPDRPVYYLEQTGEIFETYECVYLPPVILSTSDLILLLLFRAYAARMSFYRLRQFQCEVTGKSGLDYFQALESERQEARTLHSRFSEPLKPAVLKAVQWRMSLSQSPLLPPLLTARQRSWGDWITSWRLFTNASRTAISWRKASPKPCYAFSLLILLVLARSCR